MAEIQENFFDTKGYEQHGFRYSPEQPVAKQSMVENPTLVDKETASIPQNKFYN